MGANHEDERNRTAYVRLKETIRKTYPRGWFVGIAGDQIIGAAADFRDLESMIQSQGKDPRGVLVVEAGVDYPDYATIILCRTAPSHQPLQPREIPTESEPYYAILRPTGEKSFQVLAAYDEGLINKASFARFLRDPDHWNPDGNLERVRRFFETSAK